MPYCMSRSKRSKKIKKSKSKSSTKRSRSIKRGTFRGGACTSEFDPISQENIDKSVPLKFRVSIPTGIIPNQEHCFDFRQLVQWLKIPKYDVNNNRVFINPYTNIPFTNDQLEHIVMDNRLDGNGYGQVLDLIRITIESDPNFEHYFPIFEQYFWELVLIRDKYDFWFYHSLLGQSSYWLKMSIRPILTSLGFELEEILLDRITYTLERNVQSVEIRRRIRNQAEPEQEHLVLPPNEQVVSSHFNNFSPHFNDNVRDATDQFLVIVPTLGNGGAANWQVRDVRDFLKAFLATGRSSVLTLSIFEKIFSDMVSQEKIYKLVKTFMNLATEEIRTFCLQRYPDPNGSID